MTITNSGEPPISYNTGDIMRKYFDKHGKEIRAGMTLRHDGGETWEVAETTSSLDGEKDLGMVCNPWEAYPLWSFDLSEWEILYETEEG